MPIEQIEADPARGVLTVAQLKALVADWPEEDADGEPTEVWLSSGWCLSSPCVLAGPLNGRSANGKWVAASLILELAAHQTPPDREGRP